MILKISEIYIFAVENVLKNILIHKKILKKECEDIDHFIEFLRKNNVV